MDLRDDVKQKFAGGDVKTVMTDESSA